MTLFQKIEAAEKLALQFIKETGQKYLLDMGAIAEAEFMHEGKKSGKLNTTSQLYKDSETLVKSLYKNRGSSNSIQKLNVTGGKIDAEFGSNVVYAAIHEYGGRAGRGGSVTIKKRPYIKPAEKVFQEKVLPRLVAQFRQDLTNLFNRN